MNTITLRRVWKLSVEVRKQEYQGGNENERQGETAMWWACYGHVGLKGVKAQL